MSIYPIILSDSFRLYPVLTSVRKTGLSGSLHRVKWLNSEAEDNRSLTQFTNQSSDKMGIYLLRTNIC
jgi:hypothetical protein